MRKFREMIFSGGEKGFTLIELLVVIAVLGILAGIAIPRISGITEKARENEMRATANTVRSLIELSIASGNGVPVGSTTSFSSTGDYNIDVDLSEYSISNFTDDTTTGGNPAYSLTLTRDGYKIDIDETGISGYGTTS
jgi:prepilin-type N-terminal cleavage/methylation domain-containing protein